MIKKLAAAASLLLLSTFAHAIPFSNGSFEDLGGQSLQRGNWGYFPNVPGWTGGDHLEIHLGNGGSTFVTPAEGEYYAELNAHPRQTGSFRLFQTFDTVIGQTYDVEFFARKRKRGDGHFFFSVGDLGDIRIDDHVRGGWTDYSFQFTASDWSSTLSFLSGQGGRDTVGHYLDDISVTPIAIPEPGVLALFGIGFLGLIATRRRITR